MRNWAAAALVGVIALAISVAAQQTVAPPKTVPPITAPTMPTTPIVTTPMRGTVTAIVGQVVDTTGRPVPKAAVRLIADKVIETVLTDPKGRFSFTQIPPGEMVVVAQKNGYFDGGFGQRRATGLPLPFSLPLGRTMPNMKIEIFRGSTVTGLVRDETGEPIAGARVLAARRQFVGNQWQYVAVDSEETTDQGEYRIFGLQPGEYIVTVLSMPVAGNKQGDVEPADRDRPRVFPRIFYPQAPDRAIALTVALAPGDVRYAVDFMLPPVKAHRVTGRLWGQNDVGNLTVRLVPKDATWATDEVASTLSAADGTFEFDEVPEGEYRLEAGNVRPRGWTAKPGVLLADELNAARPYCGTTALIVRGGDITVPDIEMVQTAAIAGALELRRIGASQTTAPRVVPISIEPAAPGLSRGHQMNMSPGIPFAISDLIPGPYFVRVGSIPSGWALDSMEIDGFDVMNHPVDLKDADAIVNIRIANRGTEIIGTVRDNRMQAAQGAAVIIIPSDVSRENWSPSRVRETRTSTAGVFNVRGLPPGQYMVIVIDDAQAEGWQDDRALARLMPLATRFTLQSMETLSLVLQIR